MKVLAIRFNREPVPSLDQIAVASRDSLRLEDTTSPSGYHEGTLALLRNSKVHGVENVRTD